MTDRELLELAAKAAGIGVWFSRMSDGKGGVIEPCHRTLNAETVVWNPLDDDGDALRLAVKLEINLSFSQDCAFGFWIGTPKDGEDLSSHARRAIVRAAAEIGRNME